MDIINRAGPGAVGLETTLLAHGVPRGQGERLARELAEIVREERAMPAFVGVVNGRPVVGMDFNEINEMLLADGSPRRTRRTWAWSCTAACTRRRR